MPVSTWFYLISSAFAFLTELLVSDFTPFSSTTLLSLLPPLDSQAFTFRIRTIHGNYFQDALSPDVILDYTYSQVISAQVLEERYEIIVIGMYRDCPEREIRTLLKAEEYAAQIADYLLALNFTKAFLVSQATPFDIEVSEYLLNHPLLHFIDNAVVDPDTTTTQIEHIVGRLIKPAGIRIGVFLVKAQIARKIVESLKSYYLWEQGYAFVFAEEAGWIEGPPGLLYVTDAEAIQTSSREEYEAAILHSQLAALSPLQLSASDKKGFKGKLSQMLGGMSRQSKLVLMNVQEQPRLVANSPKGLSEVLFPGNTTETPRLTKPVLHVSTDYTGLNSDGSVFPEGNVVMRGYAVAYAEANMREDLLPNYAIVNTSLSFGSFTFNETWATERIISQRDQLGLAFAPFGFAAASEGVNRVFRKLGISIPTTSVGGSPVLSDPNQSPLFYTTISNPALIALATARFFHVFGWKKCAFIYSDAMEDMQVYEVFVNVSAQYNIEITNSRRQVPYDLTNADKQINETLEEILASSVRIIFISHPVSFIMVERLYDLGARAGDYLICLYYTLSYTLYGGPDLGSWKRRNVAKGAMMVYDRYFVGKEGERVRQLLQAVDHLNYEHLGCPIYDSVILLIQALKFMLVTGLHYEDGEALMQQIRYSRIVGCLGMLFLEKGSNERTPGDYSILNAKYDEEKDILVLEEAAVYSPAKVQMYNISSDIMFPDGSSERFPDSWQVDSYCPYFVKDIKNFFKGQMLGLGICLLIAFFTAVSALLIWKWTWKVKYEMLDTKSPITLEDGLALLNFPVKFCQVIALAPSNPLDIHLKAILHFTTFSWEMFINATYGAFWALEIMTFVLVICYLLISILKYLRLGVLLKMKLCLSDIRYLVGLLLPSLSNLTFLPIISILFSNFTCSRSTGDTFTDSFLDRDCSEKCWTGAHLIYTIIAAILIVIYIPAVLATRPVWQKYQENLHLKAMPYYILAESVFQVFLVAIATSLRRHYQIIHAFCYLVIMLAYLVLVCLFKPYNYER